MLSEAEDVTPILPHTVDDIDMHNSFTENVVNSIPVTLVKEVS